MPEDDIEDIREYAFMKKISLKEALTSNFIKTLLANKEEERATAVAMHTGSSRRSTGKKSNDQILNDVEKGELPDDASLVVKARLQKRIDERNANRR